jgi:iron complex transport system permease protein
MHPVIQPRALFLALGLLLLLALWLSLALGPVSLPLQDTLQAALRLIGLPLGGAELQQAVERIARGLKSWRPDAL